jgi:hypothetical protein
MLSRSTDSAVPCVSVHARACVRSRKHTHPRTHGTHTLLSKTIETEDAVNMGNQKAPWTAAMGGVDGCLALFTKCMCYCHRVPLKSPPNPSVRRQGSPCCGCSASAGACARRSQVSAPLSGPGSKKKLSPRVREFRGEWRSSVVLA